jgi:hypothetical protein
MLRRLFVAALAVSVLFLTPSVAGAARMAPVAAGSLQMFATEDAAQRHSPRDIVVWLNTNSGVYHEKGMRWYGRTKRGAYACEKKLMLWATATRGTGNDARRATPLCL